MLVEAKAETLHFIAHYIIEHTVKPVTLHPIKSATFQSAQDADSKEGDFKKAADHYYTVFSQTSIDEEKVKALIGLSQELVNLGSFRQVRILLRNHAPALLDSLPLVQSTTLEAQIEEKLGWIEDYELGFFQSKEHFTKAGRLLKLLRVTGDLDRERFSTTRHFLGRASYGLAALGVDKASNIRQATGWFEEALALDEQLPNNIHLNLKLGFGHGWLSRTYLMLGDHAKSDEELNKMREYFEKQLEITPGRVDLMAHYHFLKGHRNFKLGLVAESKRDFQEALGIRINTTSYPKGLADAYAGLSAVSLKEHNPLLAATYLFRAIRTNPYAVLRGIAGG